MPVTEIPDNRIYGYDYCNLSWRSVAVSHSGHTIAANSEMIFTKPSVLATGASGGIALGTQAETSGYLLRSLVISVPRQACSGSLSYWGYSGEGLQGIFVGGFSGNAPWGSPCISSGKGLFVGPNHEKRLNVDALSDVYIATPPDISGLPISVIGEMIPCP